MNFWIGTSGFSYKEWKGNFYPSDLPNTGMLSYYAERLRSVEINSTFYRMPKTSVLEGWLEQVPETFRFVLKASRRITHQKKLAEAGDDLKYLAETSSALGENLGPLLIQLPPYLKKDVALLRDFLGAFPPGVRAAFEFRSSSWFDDEVYQALSDHAMALVTSDTEKLEADAPVVATTSYGYSRLRRPGYDEHKLAAWAERLSTPEWEDCFVFFKHEDEGTGPRLAAEFEGLVTPIDDA